MSLRACRPSWTRAAPTAARSRRSSRTGLVPAWRGVTPDEPHLFGDADLIVGASFRDLAAGFTAIAVACAAAEAGLSVQISEAPPEGDPLAFLRPSSPAATRPDQK